MGVALVHPVVQGQVRPPVQQQGQPELSQVMPALLAVDQADGVEPLLQLDCQEHGPEGSSLEPKGLAGPLGVAEAPGDGLDVAEVELGDDLGPAGNSLEECHLTDGGTVIPETPVRVSALVLPLNGSAPVAIS